MAVDLTSLVRLTKAEVKPAAKVLSRAFQDYPMMEYHFGDEAARRKITLSFVSLAVYCGIRYGEVYATSSRIEGVAVWFSSDNYPLSFLRMLRCVPLSVLYNFARYGGARMKNLGKYVDSTHKRLAPFRHYYLQVIGVDPHFQGKGYASKLLKPMIARIDEEGLPCYLETLDDNNVSLYERYGFRVIERSTVPGTELNNWAMLREKDN